MLIVVDDGVSTREVYLDPEAFALVEYNKAMREGKYPVFVLTNCGTQDHGLPSTEIVWTYSGIQKQVQNRKKSLFLDKLLTAVRV
jgi:hypothetical protein